ncbi:MAG TPA: COX15/CtaA family protein [Solirubrobacteraceae bacterium]|nr:COX15/CtaA family protein [Solirubrobacteraceae bacterium]
MRDRIARFELTPRQFALLSLLSLIALTVIVATGAAVRLSGSGLGCPDWPRCYGHVYPPLQTHALIEFSNRVVSGTVGLVVVLAAIGAWRRRPFRRDLLVLALLLPLGVIGQAVLGGYTVEEKLAPGFVMAHFCLSMLILVAAATLAWRARERPPAETEPDRPSVWAVRALLPLATIVVFAGTAATAAGPHSGGATGQQIKRLTFEGADTLKWTVHVHGAIAFAFGIAAVAVWVLLERRQAVAEARRAMSWLCALIAVQGVVGAVQYETHLPTELVWVHVGLASLCWLCVLWAVAAIGGPNPLRARKRPEIRASMLTHNPATSGPGASFGQASDHLRGVS